jgi:hypothetical protein
MHRPKIQNKSRNEREGGKGGRKNEGREGKIVTMKSYKGTEINQKRERYKEKEKNTKNKSSITN